MKEPTAEQKAKAQARREKMRAISKKISDMTDDERLAFARTVQVVTIDGRTLSPHNQCMLAFQNPAVTVVGGFQQWRKAGRMVRKGEHGLAIWIPVGAKVENQETGDKETAAVDYFTLATVFDVAQTDERTAPAKHEGPSLAAVVMGQAAPAELAGASALGTPWPKFGQDWR